MTYGPGDISILAVDEAISKRPGMYLGDLSALGTARLVAMAVDVLVAMTVNRVTNLSFSHHAFLDVSMCGRDVEIALDYHPNECPDILFRCACLEESRFKMQPDEYALDQDQNSVAPMPILNALTSDLCLYRIFGERVKPVLGAIPIDFPTTTTLAKGALIGARFRVKEMIETSGLTRDYLEGFLQGSQQIPGLIVRDIVIKQHS